MQQPRVWQRDERHVLATYRNVFVSQWMSAPYRNYAEEAPPMCEAILQDFPDGMLLAIVVEDSIKSVSPKDLQQGAAVLRQYVGHVRSICVVTRGDRLQNTLIRSAGAAIFAFADTNYSVTFSGTVAQMLTHFETAGAPAPPGPGFRMFLHSIGIK